MNNNIEKDIINILKHIDRVELELLNQNEELHDVIKLYNDILTNLINEYQLFCEKIFN